MLIGFLERSCAFKEHLNLVDEDERLEEHEELTRLIGCVVVYRHTATKPSNHVDIIFLQYLKDKQSNLLSSDISPANPNKGPTDQNHDSPPPTPRPCQTARSPSQPGILACPFSLATDNAVMSAQIGH